MLKSVTLSVLSILLTCTLSANAGSDTKLTTDSEIASYSIGFDFGRGLKSHDISKLDTNALIIGIKDALVDKKPQITKEQLSQSLDRLFKEEREKMKKLSQENLAASKVFLADNAKKDGVHTTQSGLQYKIIQEGKGKKPTKDDVVITNYRGTLIDGKEFDSSYKRDKPIEFPVGHVIPGWTEALLMMPVGSHWTLYIPPNLAYGERSPSRNIPPNALLIFEIELLDIKKAKN